MPAGVSVVGTCAHEVVIQGSLGAPGLQADGADGVHIEGLTVQGASIGIQGYQAKDLVVRRVVLDSNQRGIGLTTSSAYVDASRITGTTADGQVSVEIVAGYGIFAAEQSLLVAHALAVEDSNRTGISVSNSEVSLVGGTVVRQSGGTNVQLQAGASGLLDGARIEASTPNQTGSAAGVVLFTAGRVDITTTAFEDNGGPALVVDDSGPIRVEGNRFRGGEAGVWIQRTARAPAVRNNTFEKHEVAGVVVLGSSALIGPGNTISAIGSGSAGAMADGIHVVGSSNVEILGNTIVGVERIGVLVATSASVDIVDNAVQGADGACSGFSRGPLPGSSKTSGQGALATVSAWSPDRPDCFAKTSSGTSAPTGTSLTRCSSRQAPPLSSRRTSSRPGPRPSRTLYEPEW